MTVAVHQLSKRFEAFAALDDVSLEVRDGEFLALLGPSGSGKTTLLRVLAGLAFPDEGRVLFGGEDVTERAARERRVGFVFQHYALFRHMTVAENVAFGLSVRPRSTRPAKSEIARRVNELLELVQLGPLGKRYPAQLSGGQRQRVALARALAVEPRLLLLDEPFGALDAQVRKDLRRWLRRIHDETGLTSIFVTHDQEEALELADRVAVMNKGRIEQIDTPAELYDHPATAFVCGFIGQANRFDGAVEGGTLTIEGARFAAPAGAVAGPVTAFVRPHEWRVAHGGEGLPVTVRAMLRSGPGWTLEGETFAGTLVEAALPNDAAMRPGASVVLTPETVRVYAR